MRNQNWAHRLYQFHSSFFFSSLDIDLQDTQKNQNFIRPMQELKAGRCQYEIEKPGKEARRNIVESLKKKENKLTLNERFEVKMSWMEEISHLFIL